MDILFLSPADWSCPRGRFQHIAERFAAHNRVLYVDGLGMRSLATRDLGRSARKLARWLLPRESRPTSNGDLMHITPVAAPFQRGAWSRRLNHYLLRSHLRVHMAQQGFRRPLIWLAYPHPDLVEVVERLEAEAVIYDCVDDWREFHHCYHNIGAAEDALLARADLVFATTTQLHERAQIHNAHTHLVPNGVDVDSFAQAAFDSGGLPADLAQIPRPRIGFVGNIAEWVDIDLLMNIAREHPSWHFVMVGPYQREAERPAAANLHWIGTRPYVSVPDYVAGCDVGIIPFKQSRLTECVDPLKLYEYLAAGRPVVSTPMPRAQEFSGLVEIADTPSSFSQAIERALQSDDESAQIRIDAMRPHSWVQRVESIMDTVRLELDIEIGPLTTKTTTRAAS